MLLRHAGGIDQARATQVYGQHAGVGTPADSGADCVSACCATAHEDVERTFGKAQGRRREIRLRLLQSRAGNEILMSPSWIWVYLVLSRHPLRDGIMNVTVLLDRGVDLALENVGVLLAHETAEGVVRKYLGSQAPGASGQGVRERERTWPAPSSRQQRVPWSRRSTPTPRRPSACALRLRCRRRTR